MRALEATMPKRNAVKNSPLLTHKERLFHSRYLDIPCNNDTYLDCVAQTTNTKRCSKPLHTKGSSNTYSQKSKCLLFFYRI